MASAESIVAMYMASADSDLEEANANITELSRRTTPLSSLLIKGIQSRKLKLLDFVQILGEYLTHEESSNRKNGMESVTLADGSVWMFVWGHCFISPSNIEYSRSRCHDCFLLR
jgi:hypothetical protein